MWCDACLRSKQSAPPKFACSGSIRHAAVRRKWARLFATTVRTRNPSTRKMVIPAGCSATRRKRWAEALSTADVDMKGTAIFTQRHIVLHDPLYSSNCSGSFAVASRGDAVMGFRSQLVHDSLARCFLPRTTRVQSSGPPMKGPIPIRLAV